MFSATRTQIIPNGGTGSVTLGTGQVYTSDPVDVDGAQELVFTAFATNASVLQAAVYEYSLDGGVTWFAENNGWFDKPSVSMAATDLSTAAGAIMLCPREAGGVATQFRHLIATHIRLKVTGPAAGTTTGFRAYVRVYPVG